MIQPTEYITMSEDGKLIEYQAIVKLAMEITDQSGRLPLHRIIKELQMARDGIRRPEPWEELEKKLLEGEITEQEFVEAVNDINSEESRRMADADQCGQPHEHI